MQNKTPMATINESVQTLEEFLALPETEPASEFIEGTVVQKPMSKGSHSRLQAKLVRCLNDALEPALLAFPELRCTFGGRSLVPDISLFDVRRIPGAESGEIAEDFHLAPDLAVEIVSLDQDANELVEKLGFCLCSGVRLGWLIDPHRRQVLVFRQDALPQHLPSDGTLEDRLLLGEFRLALAELFGWLKLPVE